MGAFWGDNIIYDPVLKIWKHKNLHEGWPLKICLNILLSVRHYDFEDFFGIFSKLHFKMNHDKYDEIKYGQLENGF